MEDKEDGGASLFPHQIVDFAPAPAQPVPRRTFPHPLHYTVALDSGSEARYVLRQGRGLGI